MSRIPAVLLVGIVLSSCVFAQSATGIIQGRVSDASGASIPDSTVTVQNERTGVKQVLKSNSDGNFIQPYLIPSEYSVAVEKQGFQKFQTRGVVLDVQKTVDLDILLKVGAVTDTIEVKADAVQLSTSSSSVSTVINRRAMLDLPLNGRNPFALVNLTPGVTGGGGLGASISGGRGGTNEITVDGTTVVVPENNVSTNDTGYTPIVDSIEEFSVITNSLSAEYGRSGGGVINVASRSGSNTLHGSLFEFVRNDIFNANSWGNNRNGTKKNPSRINQYGGQITGPLSIPHVYDGKNRTFFAFTEQETTNHGFASGTATVPTDAWRSGNFTGLKNTAGQDITIYDPATVACTANCGASNAVYTRTPFLNNVIPANRLDKAALAFQKYYPAANNPGGITNVYTQANNYSNSGASVSDDHKFDARVDHNFSQAFRLWVRGSYEKSPASPFNLYKNLGTSGDGPNFGVNYNTALNSVYTISPTMILNVNYGLARKVYHRDPFSQGIDLTTLGLPQSVYAQAATQNLEFPSIGMGGNQSISGLGQSTFTALRIQSYDHDIHSDITKVLTKHTLKAGLEYRKLFINFRQNGQPSGQFNFNNVGWTQLTANTKTFSTTQGLGYANFLLGLPNASLAGDQGSGGTTEHTFAAAQSSAYMGFYAQDDWKVNRKLTLNIGLRWDVDIPRTERYNRLSYFDLNAASPIAGKVPGFANLKGAYNFVGTANSAFGRHQAPTDMNNWGPRFGFAYAFDTKTVFRGAYGITYGGSVQQASGTSGSSGTSGFSGNTAVNSSFDGISVLATLSNPFPNGFNLPLGPNDGPTSGRFTNLGLGVGGDGTLFTDYQNPLIQQWSANVQRELPARFVAEVGYIGSKGSHILDNETGAVYNQVVGSYASLGSQLRVNVPNPFFGIITNPTSGLSKATVTQNQLLRPYPQYADVNAYRKPGGNSNYHAMTISIQKRYSGLNMQLSFTGGKSIDDTSSQPQGNGNSGSKQDGYNRKSDRSLSAFDISHRLVMFANYELPFGKGRMMLASANRITEAVLGGWQLNGIYTLQNGAPLQVSSGQNTTYLFSPGQRLNNNGTSANLDNAAAGTNGCPSQTVGVYGFCGFNTTGFSLPADYTFGNVGRVLPDLRGAGSNNLDVSLFKDYKLRENRARLRFQAEAYGVANHPIWGNPSTGFNTPGTFGVYTSKNSGTRTMQLALRLNF